MPIFKDLSPLDASGVQDHRPEVEVQWSTLKNVIFKEGGIARRPGLRFPTWFANGPLHDWRYPNVDRGLPVAIIEIENPGDTTTGREGFKWIEETELPNSNTELVAGWTGDYGDIDESPPNGSDFMYSSTDGAQEIIGFTNTSEDFDAVSHIVLRGRAKTSGIAAPQTLNFYYRSGTTNYLIGSVVVYGSVDGEAPA